MKTGQTIVIAAVIGAVGYFAYKQYEKNKGKGDGDGTGDEPKGGTGSESPTPSSSGETNPNIRALQNWLEIKIDGDAGKVTNGKVEYYWSNYDNPFNADKMLADGYPNLKKYGKGVVTESNAKYYLDTLKAANSPRQLYNINKTKTAADGATDAARRSRALAVRSAYSGANKLKVNKAATFSKVVYDAVSKTFKNTGTSTLTYAAGSTFLSPESYSTFSAGRVLINNIQTNGFVILTIKPVFGADYQLRVSPYDLDVIK